MIRINVTITEELCFYIVCTALSSKISNRLTEYAQKIAGDYQNGFRINRGTIKNIHILRQITEKARV